MWETACCRCAPFGILSQGERDGVTIHSSMGAKPLLTCPWIALLLFSMDGGVFAFRYQGREKRSLFWLQSGGIAYGPRPDLKSKLEIFQCFDTCLQTIPNCRFRGIDVALGRATAARGLSQDKKVS